MAGYGDDEGFAAWLGANGYDEVGDLEPAVLRQRGSAYIDGVYGPRFSGSPTGGYAQERAFPRTGATAYSVAIPDSIIPVAVVQASYAAALHEGLNPGSLSVAVSASATVKREKVGPIEVEYASGSGDILRDGQVTLSVVEGLLAPFLIPDAPDVPIGIWAIGGSCR